MANQEHVERLRKSTTQEWNDWREENPQIIPDLEGADLNNGNFTGVNLRDSKLRGATFVNSYLEGVDLRGADIRDIVLTRAYIDKIKITRSQQYLIHNALGIIVFPYP
jgi:hypothetical protein